MTFFASKKDVLVVVRHVYCDKKMSVNEVRIAVFHPFPIACIVTLRGECYSTDNHNWE